MEGRYSCVTHTEPGEGCCECRRRKLFRKLAPTELAMPENLTVAQKKEYKNADSSSCLEKTPELARSQYEAFPPEKHCISEESIPAIHSQLICPSCKKLYACPLMLPCLHSVCKKCIGKLTHEAHADNVGHFNITCPVCKSDNYFSSKDKVLFPPNHLLANTVNRYRKNEDKLKSPLIKLFKKNRTKESQISCHLCKIFKKPAVKRCTTCNLNYCKECFKKHHKTEASVRHTLTVPKDENGSYIKCFYHPERHLDLYCMTDRTTICQECRMAAHEDHELLSLQEAYRKEANALLDDIIQIGRQKRETEEEILKLTNFNANLRASISDLSQWVNDRSTEYHDVMQCKQQKITTCLENKILEKQEGLGKYLNYASTYMSSREAFLKDSKWFAEEQDKITFLDSSKEIISYLNEAATGLLMPAPSLYENPIHDFKYLLRDLTDKISTILSELVDSLPRKEELDQGLQPISTEDISKIMEEASQNSHSRMSSVQEMVKPIYMSEQEVAKPISIHSFFSKSAISISRPTVSQEKVTDQQDENERTKSAPPIPDAYSSYTNLPDLFCSSGQYFTRKENPSAASFVTLKAT